MTSFFFKEHETDFGNLIVEIKTLNSRYFELQLKLSEDLKIIEPKIRNQILTNISRGKTDFKLYLKPIEGDLDIKKIDFTQIKNLIRTSEKVSSLIKNPQPIDPLELIRLSGSKKNKYEIKKLEKIILKHTKNALSELIVDRKREGAKIRKIIIAKLNQIEKLVLKVNKILPKAIRLHQNKINNKFKAALINIDEDRLKQEFLIFVQKGDVQEELDRLGAHISELKRLLNKSEPVGKKIDFLMQEFNREANTLGSKSISRDISQISIDLKVLIDQIREQIQNIE
ncbi:MAG: YicC/YloC family endoribonuclease [Methylophilaceae bacterium]|tara:strand:+ start:744 stop:1595 length:852 start_codon:yes stop_codon:yes gene_type:complete